MKYSSFNSCRIGKSSKSLFPTASLSVIPRSSSAAVLRLMILPSSSALKIMEGDWERMLSKNLFKFVRLSL